ncbi:protein mago nashi [Anaeramoeba flamelloides]|uniref:Protein mago nashi n=1 Tax=Anaeramoeba flamelloides TaxID=1746091 RepID=A0AAV7ZSF0_9EUKA|nr:protein mago nashi [Anaeramoeba flamelloides]KAJ6243907.1 protein mago nashi [Anaeramoeba flamelloides]
MEEEFYLRFQCVRKKKNRDKKTYVSDTLSIEVTGDGLVTYKNSSKYKLSEEVKLSVNLTPIVLEEIVAMVDESNIFLESDSYWPEPDEFGSWEIEIVRYNEHISFLTKIFTYSGEFKKTKDPEGVAVLYYLVKNLESFIHSLLNSHQKRIPFGRK